MGPRALRVHLGLPHVPHFRSLGDELYYIIISCDGLKSDALYLNVLWLGLLDLYRALRLWIWLKEIYDLLVIDLEEGALECELFRSTGTPRGEYLVKVRDFTFWHLWVWLSGLHLSKDVLERSLDDATVLWVFESTIDWWGSLNSVSLTGACLAVSKNGSIHSV